MYAIYCWFIWCYFLLSEKQKKQKRCFWFVKKLKLKFVNMFNYVLYTRLSHFYRYRLFLRNVCIPHFCFAPGVFYNSSTNHQIGMGRHYQHWKHLVENSICMFLEFIFWCSLKFIFLMWNPRFNVGALLKMRELIIIKR